MLTLETLTSEGGNPPIDRNFTLFVVCHRSLYLVHRTRKNPKDNSATLNMSDSWRWNCTRIVSKCHYIPHPAARYTEATNTLRELINAVDSTCPNATWHLFTTEPDAADFIASFVQGTHNA
jgi:hypothetical protein